MHQVQLHERLLIGVNKI